MNHNKVICTAYLCLNKIRMDKSTSAASNLRSQNKTILQNEICDKGNCYTTLQRHNNENSKQIFPEKELPTA